MCFLPQFTQNEKEKDDNTVKKFDHMNSTKEVLREKAISKFQFVQVGNEKGL